MKIGILGGTFNPVHNGHLIMAEEVREKLGLDKILFIPTNIPPHKESADIASANSRIEMLKLAIKGNPNFSISDIEIKRGGKSYTIDTIRALKEKSPFDKFYFLIGSDLLTCFDGWKDINEITKLVTFVVATRPGFSVVDVGNYLASQQVGIKTLDIRAVDISGYSIRSAIRAGRSFRYLVPDKVYNYITKKRIYQIKY